MAPSQTAQIVPARDRMDTLVQMLDRLRPQMKAALPKHLSAERMARIATTTLRRTPQLMECTPISFAGAIIQACQLGLEPDGFLGEFYLTPRRLQGVWNVVGIPGYRGLAKLARQSGDVDWLMPHAVYQANQPSGDVFDWEYGAVPKLIHKPGISVRDPKLITHFYAVARLKSGQPLFWVMTRAEIDEVRQRYAAARDDGPWVTHYTEMGMKTPMRRLCKFLPQSPLLGRAVALDELAEAGLPQGLDALVDPTSLGIDRPAGNGTLQKISEAMDQDRQARDTAAPPAPATGGSSEAEGAVAGETHAPPPVVPPAARPPRPPRARQFPRTLERPKSAPVETEADAPPPRTDPAWAVDAADAADRLAGNAAEPVAPPPVAAAPPVSSTTVFDLIKGATSPEALDDTAERIYSSEAYAKWDEGQRRLVKDAITRQRRTFAPSAA